jgi:hypothetical protein
MMTPTSAVDRVLPRHPSINKTCASVNSLIEGPNEQSGQPNKSGPCVVDHLGSIEMEPFGGALYVVTDFVFVHDFDLT